MPKVLLSSHTLKVREARKSESIPLGSFGFGSQRGFHRFLERRLRELTKEHHHNEASQTVLRVRTLDGDDRALWGLVEGGDYGFGAQGYNVRKSQLSYKRSPDDAELMPFYFHFSVPNDATEGLIVLQRLGVHGVQTPLLRDIASQFRGTFPGYTLDYNRHVPDEVIKYLSDGSVKALSFTIYEMPEDLADKVRLRGYPQENLRVRIKLEGLKDRYLPRPDWLKGKLNRRTFFEQRFSQDIPEDASVTMEYNGNRRTVSFRNPESITPHIDVSNEVELNALGHPSYDDIHAIACNLMADLEKEIGRMD